MAEAADVLLTAEDVLRLPNDGIPKELVRGRLVTRKIHTPRHGHFCATIIHVLHPFVDNHRLGRLVSNNCGVVTRRSPDTVRGPDIAFYSYTGVAGPFPDRYLGVMPELVFEVLSPEDRWQEVMAKVGEYLAAGVRYVCVLDDQTESVHVFDGEDAPRIITGDQELTLPEVLPDFRAPVRAFFD